MNLQKRKEELIFRNKCKMYKYKLIEDFDMNFEMKLNDKLFYNTEDSKKIIAQAYNHIDNLESLKFNSYNHLFQFIESTKKEFYPFDNQKIILFSDYSEYVGGIFISVSQFFNIIDKLFDYHKSGILLAVHPKNIFGIFLYRGEHQYELIKWTEAKS